MKEKLTVQQLNFTRVFRCIYFVVPLKADEDFLLRFLQSLKLLMRLSFKFIMVQIPLVSTLKLFGLNRDWAVIVREQWQICQFLFVLADC